MVIHIQMKHTSLQQSQSLQSTAIFLWQTCSKHQTYELM